MHPLPLLAAPKAHEHSGLSTAPHAAGTRSHGTCAGLRRTSAARCVSNPSASLPRPHPATPTAPPPWAASRRAASRREPRAHSRRPPGRAALRGGPVTRQPGGLSGRRRLPGLNQEAPPPLLPLRQGSRALRCRPPHVRGHAELTANSASRRRRGAVAAPTSPERLRFRRASSNAGTQGPPTPAPASSCGRGKMLHAASPLKCSPTHARPHPRPRRSWHAEADRPRGTECRHLARSAGWGAPGGARGAGLPPQPELWPRALTFTAAHSRLETAGRAAARRAGPAVGASRHRTFLSQENNPTRAPPLGSPGGLSGCTPLRKLTHLRKPRFGFVCR